MIVMPMLCVSAFAAQPNCGGNNTCGRWLESQGTFACDGEWCTCNYKQYTCGCEYDWDCPLNYGSYACVNNKCQECKSCSNCESSSWLYFDTGYQFQLYKWCSCDGTCNSTNNYRCDSGYYGHSSDGETGCSPCPEQDGKRGTSSPGSAAVTGCYFPANSKGTDATGDFSFVSACYYKN